MDSFLQSLRNSFPEMQCLPPASDDVIEAADGALGGLPARLREILSASNGLVCRSFRLYSAFDETQPKKTWESLQRANDPAKSDALGGSRELHDRFLVIADIGNGHGFVDRTDSSIWFAEEHDGELWRTDMTLDEFIKTMVEHAE